MSGADGLPRTAAVIGGSTGIGRGVADAWAALGIETHVFSRSRPAGAGGDRLHWHPLDLREAGEAKAALRSGLPDRLGFVCYSAVYFTAGRAPFVETDEKDWMDQFAVNVHGLSWTLRAALPRLRTASPGLFLHISSEVVYNGGPDRSGYAATKAAADSLVRSLSQETDPAEVRFVQALPAAMVDTPGIRSRRPSGFDYSGYMTPAAFTPLATELVVRTGGLPHPAGALVVHHDGSWSSVGDRPPTSQSRPSAAARASGSQAPTLR